MVHLSLYFSPVSASPPCGDAHSSWASERLNVSVARERAQRIPASTTKSLESFLTAPFYYGNLHRKPSWTFVQRSQTGTSAPIGIGVSVHAGNVAIDTTKITTIYGNIRLLWLCTTVSFALAQIITVSKTKVFTYVPFHTIFHFTRLVANILEKILITEFGYKN